ncbi:MAG: ribose-phosphate diphosphokinase [Nanoarchaeota archaeon]|nr:ribose-phosphate diphosphokinase [Nanoarchaeota archaeon]
MIITSCGNSIKLAKSLARKLKAQYSPLTISSFPDGDIYLKYNTSVKGKKVIIVQSFHPSPNSSLMRVIFAAETAKDLGARKVILVAPYLAYMRQDTRFHAGEAISSRIMAKLLNHSIDKIITIDPHLHRYKSLKTIFTIPAVRLTANSVIAEYISKKFDRAKTVIIGPDRESYQWAESIAAKTGMPSTVLEKTRFTSKKVRVKMIKPIPLKGKDVVIIDDIISTGHTIIEAAKKAKSLGAKSITAIGVHGLFVEGLLKLQKAGIKVISTNCIEHTTNKIDVAPVIVEALRSHESARKRLTMD